MSLQNVLVNGDKFAGEGNLEKMQTQIMEYTTNAMDWASAFGHLEVVKWLHEQGKNCTTWAMDYASRNEYLDVVKFLQKNRRE